MTPSATAKEKEEGMGNTQLSLSITEPAMVIMERKNGELIYGTNPSDIKTIHVFTPLVTEGKVELDNLEIKYACSLVPQVLTDQTLSQYIRKIPTDLSVKIFDKALMRLPQLMNQLNYNGTVYDEQSVNYENRDYKLYYMFKLQ